MHANLQLTSNVQVSSICEAGITGFSARHRRIFPMSSTLGWNLNVLDVRLPPSDGWKKRINKSVGNTKNFEIGRQTYAKNELHITMSLLHKLSHNSKWPKYLVNLVLFSLCKNTKVIYAFKGAHISTKNRTAF